MKTERNLSGIYFRTKINGSFENRTFEDLEESEQDRVMEGRDIEWLRSLAKQLANTINSIGEQFNISAD